MRLFFSLLLLLTVGITAAQDAAGEFTDHPARVVSNISALRVRSSPAIEAENIVGQLRPGQRVQVLAREGDWQQVRREDGLVGWSHSDYLIDLPARQIGETRLFRILVHSLNRYQVVNAELVYIGAHSYTYVYRDIAKPTIPEAEIRRMGEAFDERIYKETFALWPSDPLPSHEGDERIVILVNSTDIDHITNQFTIGWYNGREGMPGDANPSSNRSGFLGYVWLPGTPGHITDYVITHELQHLIQHVVAGNDVSWVNEGLSEFTVFYLGYSDLDFNDFLKHPQTQLNHDPVPRNDGSYCYPCSRGAIMLFLSYIHDRLGLEGLQAFAAHPAWGLAGLDEVLVDLGLGMDADSFFADWVLANYLFDDQLGNGQYGFPSLKQVYKQQPSCRTLIHQLPFQFHSENNPYATEYYEIPLPSGGQSQQLELELQLQLANPYPQDAWLQWVEVRDGQVELQRFRASEYRGRPMLATLHEGTERAFIAFSPFTPANRESTVPTRYTLSIQALDGHVSWSDTQDTLCIPLNADSPTQLRPAASYLERMREERSTAINSVRLFKRDRTADETDQRQADRSHPKPRRGQSRAIAVAWRRYQR